MRTIFLTNDRDRPVTVVIEPWAWAADLSPGEEMAIDHAKLVEREIEIRFQGDGSALLSIPADGVRIRSRGRAFECGDALPTPPTYPDDPNFNRLLPKGFIDQWNRDNAAKNPPQE